MKHAFLPLCLLSLLLTSCGEASASITSSDPSGRFLLDHNGDLYGTSGLTSYAATTIKGDADSLINEVTNGGYVCFLVSSTTCENCQNFEPRFTSYMSKHDFKIYHFEYSRGESATYTTALAVIATYYDDRTVQTTGWPSLFVGNKTSYRYISLGNVTATYLTSSFNNLTAETGIYSFRDFSQAKAYLNANPTALSFLYDSTNISAKSLYYSKIYAKAASSSKPLILFDYALMDETNRANALRAFSVNESAPLLKSGESIYNLEKESESAQADSLISAYYA